VTGDGIAKNRVHDPFRRRRDDARSDRRADRRSEGSSTLPRPVSRRVATVWISGAARTEKLQPVPKELRAIRLIRMLRTKQGLSFREIAQLVHQRHGVKISHVTVAAVLSRATPYRAKVGRYHRAKVGRYWRDVEAGDQTKEAHS